MIFGYSRCVKGFLLMEYNYDPAYSGRQALSFGLVCSVSLFFARDTQLLVHLIYLVVLNLWYITIEKNSPKSSCSILLLLRSQANWKACWLLKYWTIFSGLCLVLACLEEWYEIANSYLVSAMGLKFSPKMIKLAPNALLWNWSTFSHPNTFYTTSAGWWARGKVEPLLKLGCKKCMHTIGHILKLWAKIKFSLGCQSKQQEKQYWEAEDSGKEGSREGGEERGTRKLGGGEGAGGRAEVPAFPYC